MKSHDLNALTLRISQEKGVTYSQARSILAQRAAAARAAARRHAQHQQARADRARHIADRISP